MEKLGVAVIHGVGSQDANAFRERVEEMAEQVGDRLRQQGKDPDDVAWEPIYWAADLESRQVRYLSQARAQNDLDFVSLRKLVVRVLGDAAAYQHRPGRIVGTRTYDQIHGIVRASVERLYQQLDQQDRPLVVLAHSLGSVIISNYVWDLQNDLVQPPPQNSFERMETLVGFVTFGSTLPLFSFAYDPAVPITFPPQPLADELKQKARWINFFDSDDVLGYPLKQISPGYQNLAALEDREIRVGSILSGWNPAAHQGYWNDRDFTRPVADLIAQFL